jgi:hypothetical protein
MKQLGVSDSVDRASVAPAIPSSARDAISIAGFVETAAATESAPNGRAAGQQWAPTPHPVTDGTHRDERPGDDERVDVGHPQGLGAGRTDNAQPDPLTPARPRRVCGLLTKVRLRAAVLGQQRGVGRSVMR